MAFELTRTTEAAPGLPAFAVRKPAGAAPALAVKKYTQGAAAAWDAYVRRSAAASFCHLSGWGRVSERVFGQRNYSLYAERAGQWTGVLPLFHLRSRLFGSMLVSSPQAVYGGVVAADAESYHALQEAAQRLAAELQVDYLELRDTPQSWPQTGSKVGGAAGFHQQDLYVTFAHPLTTGEEALLKSFPRDIRRMIRQGPKHGLRAEIGREELLAEFYEVYAASLRRLGTPVFPQQLFAEFLREFPEASDILLVRQGAKVAGAVLSFYFGATVLPYYGGAYPEFYRSGVNNFMYWELMRRSAARGCTRFDFGRSKRGTGAYEFKRGWGMTEHALPYKFFLVRAPRLPNLNPTNPRFQWLIKTWRHLPLGLTKLLGPAIVRHLP